MHCLPLAWAAKAEKSGTRPHIPTEIIDFEVIQSMTAEVYKTSESSSCVIVKPHPVPQFILLNC